MKKNHSLLIYSFSFLLIIGFIVATFADFSINQFLYQPQSQWAIYLEAFGFYPFYLPAMLCLLFLIQHTNKNSFFKVCCMFCTTFMMAGLFWYSYTHLEKRNISSPILPVGILWCILFVAYFFLLWKEHHSCAQWRKQEQQFLFWSTLYMIIGNILVNLFKLIWNRTRFEDLIANDMISSFTPWYQPFGMGGTSFPSGHTTAACGVIVLLLLCDFFFLSKKMRFICTVIALVYPLIMGFSRLVLGRHFLSDVLFAYLMMWSIYFLLTRNKYYQQSLYTLQTEKIQNQS